MSTLRGTAHWADPSWRSALRDQHGDQLDRLKILLRRRIAWLEHRLGRPPLDGTAWTITEAQVSAALRGSETVAEEEFYRTSRAAAPLADQAAALDRQLRERAGVMAAAGTPFPLDQLCQVFGLGPFPRDVLVLALAPELDASFERLYAYAHDDAARRYPTPALAVALFGEPSPADDALGPDGSLARFGLLQPGDPEVSEAVTPLRLERRVARLLRAVDHDDGAGDVRLIPVRAVPAPEEVSAAAAPVIRALRTYAGGAAGQDGGRPAPAVNLVGGTRGQAHALAAAIARGLARSVHRPAALPSTADPRGCDAYLERESALRESLLLFEWPEEEVGAAADTLRERVESLRPALLLWSAHPVALDRPLLAVQVPPSRPASARDVWRETLGAGSEVDEALDRIVHHFRLDPDGVARVAASALATARLRGGAVSPDELWRACRRHGRRSLGGMAQRIDSRFGWDDIVLPPDVQRQLEEIAAQVRHRATVYERWRFGDKLSRGRGVTALFAGPSGTGKTMAAEVVAGELDLDLYRIDLAGVVSKYIGETEKNLRRIFESAEESGAILFFDEADALFGKRTDVRDSHDRYANIEVDYLLQRMESYTGLAILATNRRTALDRAFLRRLRFLVDFPFPATASRLRIWQRAIPETAPRADLDFAALARMELAGGNIRSIALNAAFLAAADGQVITMEHLSHAAEREFAKLDQVPTRAGPLPKPAEEPR